MSLNIPRTLKMEETVALFRMGQSQSQIAAMLKIPPETIRRWLVNEGMVEEGVKSAAQMASERPRDINGNIRVNRDVCPRCGVRGDIGCRHRPAQ